MKNLDQECGTFVIPGAHRGCEEQLEISAPSCINGNDGLHVLQVIDSILRTRTSVGFNLYKNGLIARDFPERWKRFEETYWQHELNEDS